MAGHSKWHNIQHRKNAQDAKRGKLFTKLIREIVVAAKMSGGDPESNPRLRAAIDKGLSNNMKRDVVDRAIKRGAGGGDADNYDEIRYEGYGSGGIAVMVDCLTDNHKRTVAEVRHAFSKCGGNLGTDGSVSYMFNQRGSISFGQGLNEDSLMESALEAGAEDVVMDNDGSAEVITAPTDFLEVKEALVASGFKAIEADVTMVADNTTELDLDAAQKVMRLVDMLEDLDDVQKVYTNADIPESVLAEL
ncbi:Transcriptional regulatory protein PmpR [Piscirickettsia salmonis]|uniref:Probable transcriptional regulatory protein Psal009_01805 n=1 Tax=Piscirickettsia salmonis TaxID=1238 RepID=A0A9Q6PWP6_PISSA|nr:YebC/PmpR family DNA-binding transcriptional regulator [Piscirickettsia salmonis]QGN95143.1 Transcriptional regulatory protein PmpR [Piscirickettsia salmonis]QGO05908.1 Transcriptional regulatory protein PmpR [Piscirickettsia salmonis]QGO34231.1 Transcriptional regulatory protein PmpR [Piscirickettsia salmonis]QGO37840.1 Transcriptional regulatory protein PmpR [Piscirickettsia salmonis]QGO41467.1 Transcriptional regulatory protein PmpR [Piscirickettsia salmonis]